MIVVQYLVDIIGTRKSIDHFRIYVRKWNDFYCKQIVCLVLLWFSFFVSHILLYSSSDFVNRSLKHLVCLTFFCIILTQLHSFSQWVLDSIERVSLWFICKRNFCQTVPSTVLLEVLCCYFSIIPVVICYQISPCPLLGIYNVTKLLKFAVGKSSFSIQYHSSVFKNLTIAHLVVFVSFLPNLASLVNGTDSIT